MSNKFCRFLSNGYKINVDWQGLTWSPCCFYSKKVPLLDQSQFEQALTYTSSATDWLPECHQCRLMELSGAPGLSPRLSSFQKIHTDIDDGVCGALELNLDLACNAACLSCGPYASTTWQKYEIKHQLTDQRRVKNYANNYLQQLLNTVPLDSVQNLFLLGGEPLYSPTNLTLLKHLHQVHPALDQVTLQYQTNASIIPSAEVIELWKGFKSVVISMSLDGVGERFNYLRWPLKWHRVERTVDFLLNNTDVLFNVNATISPLNVWYFDEIEQWAISAIPRDRFVKRLHWPVRPNRCMAPMDLNMTTLALRQAVIEKYGSEHTLAKVFSNLELVKNYQPMFEHIERHDQIRRLSWRKTFPEAVKYYDII
jgi:sulfatase maturation enzyme AslB (radical SAM superfamily)